MIPRADYMAGKVSHSDYYAQFANSWIRTLVEARFGRARIEQSTDPHFNDIPLDQWDALIGYSDFGGEGPKTDLGLTKAMREAGDSCTAGTLICVMKEAARQIRASAFNRNPSRMIG